MTETIEKQMDVRHDRIQQDRAARIEQISAKVHERWMENKRAKGVTSRKLDTTGEELMVPYDQLSEDAKQLDRGSVEAVISAQEELDAQGRHSFSD